MNEKVMSRSQAAYLLAVGDDDDLRADRVDLLEDVRRDDDRLALLGHGLDHLADRELLVRVDAGRQFGYRKR